MYNLRDYTLIILTDKSVSFVPLKYGHGVNAFDTANVYSNGLSERYLGNAIKVLNIQEIVVMTKVLGQRSACVSAYSQG